MWFSSTASVISWTCRARSAGIAGAWHGAVAAEEDGGRGPSASGDATASAAIEKAMRPIRSQMGRKSSSWRCLLCHDESRLRSSSIVERDALQIAVTMEDAKHHDRVFERPEEHDIGSTEKLRSSGTALRGVAHSRGTGRG